jgi:hypothetical protein
VVDLDQERDAVRPFAGEQTQHSEGRAHSVATALRGEPDDVLGVEIHRVLGKAGACGMLDALVDGEDGDIAAASQAAMAVNALEIGEHAITAV